VVKRSQEDRLAARRDPARRPALSDNAELLWWLLASLFVLIWVSLLAAASP